MKYGTLIIIVGVLLGMQCGVVAEEVEKAAFPDGVTVSELTEKEQKEAQQILDKAVATYDLILDDKNEGKQAYLTSNLEFISERITKMEADLKEKKVALENLKKEFLEKDKMIDSMSVSAEHKGKKKIQLVTEYTDRQEALEFRIGMIERHLASLLKRQNAVKAELQDIPLAPEGTGMTKAEEAEMQIQIHRSQQKMDRFSKYAQ